MSTNIQNIQNSEHELVDQLEKNQEIHINYKQICDKDGFCLVQIIPEKKSDVVEKKINDKKIEEKKEAEVVITVENQTKKIRSAYKARPKR